jgi:hypothetical protein
LVVNQTTQEVRQQDWEFKVSPGKLVRHYFKNKNKNKWSGGDVEHGSSGRALA